MRGPKRSKREISEIALEFGYVFGGLTERGHLRWLHPNGALVITGTRLSHARGWKNSVSSLRHGAQTGRKIER